MENNGQRLEPGSLQNGNMKNRDYKTPFPVGKPCSPLNLAR